MHSAGRIGQIGRADLAPRTPRRRRYRLGEQSGQSVAEQPFAVGRGEPDRASAFEEQVSQQALQPVEVWPDLVHGQRGRLDPHAAVDVITNRLGDQGAHGLDDRADRDSGALVEIGGADNPLDAGFDVQTGVRRGQRPQGVGGLQYGEELIDGGRFQWNLRAGADVNRHPGRVGQGQP
jgi:hypothetical protein